MEVSFEAVRKVQLQERNYSSLSKLDDDFYDKYLSFIKDLRCRLESGFSLEGAKAFENSDRVLKDIFEQRKHKIFFKAFRDMKNNSVDSNGLARQEKELYTSLITLLTSFNSALSTESRGAVPVGPAVPVVSQPKKILVEFLVDLPQIAGVDSNTTIGPFLKGQEAELSERQASLLSKKGAVAIKV